MGWLGAEAGGGEEGGPEDEVEGGEGEEAVVGAGGRGAGDEGGDEDAEEGGREGEPAELGEVRLAGPEEAEEGWEETPCGDHESGVGGAEADGERAFMAAGVFVDVAEVVDGDEGGAEETGLGAGEPCEGEPLAGLDEDRAADGDEAEEEDDEAFAETAVGEGGGAAGVAVGEEEGDEADGDDGPAACGDDGEGEEDGDEGGDGAGGEHGARGDETCGGGAGGAESGAGVGTFAGVDGVVEVIGGDLDGERAEERGGGEEEGELVGEPP